MKKILSTVFITLILLTLYSCKDNSLPLPEASSGMRGELGIDKNINEETIDNYLNREDSVYRDVRMLKDEANYESIGGDSYLSGFVKGFEVVPYPYLCNVEGLPEEVGSTYSGVTLFTHDENGEYIANYKESMHILESLFPKDKVIFLMCGGGGYAGMTKNMLVSLGWDETKIYNVGGYWYYKGKNNVETKYVEDNETYYNFALVNYHNIDFNTLTMINESGSKDNNSDNTSSVPGDYIAVKSTEELKKMQEDKNTFALYVYLPACSSCASFFPVLKEYVDANDIKMYAVNLRDIYKESNSVSDRIQSSPSVFLYKDGEVIAYLDPASDDDLPYYKELEKLSEWFENNIDIELIKNDCDTACSIND